MINDLQFYFSSQPRCWLIYQRTHVCSVHRLTARLLLACWSWPLEAANHSLLYPATKSPSCNLLTFRGAVANELCCCITSSRCGYSPCSRRSNSKNGSAAQVANKRARRWSREGFERVFSCEDAVLRQKSWLFVFCLSLPDGVTIAILLNKTKGASQQHLQRITSYIEIGAAILDYYNAVSAFSTAIGASYRVSMLQRQRRTLQRKAAKPSTGTKGATMDLTKATKEAAAKEDATKAKEIHGSSKGYTG